MSVPEVGKPPVIGTRSGPVARGGGVEGDLRGLSELLVTFTLYWILWDLRGLGGGLEHLFFFLVIFRDCFLRLSLCRSEVKTHQIFFFQIFFRFFLFGLELSGTGLIYMGLVAWRHAATLRRQGLTSIGKGFGPGRRVPEEESSRGGKGETARTR
jgi:hypothetical protein